MEGETTTKEITEEESMAQWALKPLRKIYAFMDKHPKLMMRINVCAGVLGTLITLLEEDGWFAAIGWFYATWLIWLASELKRLLQEVDSLRMESQKELEEVLVLTYKLRAENQRLRENVQDEERKG